MERSVEVLSVLSGRPVKADELGGPEQASAMRMTVSRIQRLLTGTATATVLSVLFLQGCGGGDDSSRNSAKGATDLGGSLATPTGLTPDLRASNADSLPEPAMTPPLQPSAAALPAPQSQAVKLSEALLSSAPVNAAAVLAQSVALRREILATEMGSPIDLAVSKAGIVFVGDRHAGLVRLDRKTGTRIVHGLDGYGRPVTELLEAIALDPEFESNRRIFLLTRFYDGRGSRLKVIRLHLDNNGEAVAEQFLLATLDAVDDTRRHAQRRNTAESWMRFGPDSRLYILATAGQERRDVVRPNQVNAQTAVFRLEKAQWGGGAHLRTQVIVEPLFIHPRRGRLITFDSNEAYPISVFGKVGESLKLSSAEGANSSRDRAAQVGFESGLIPAAIEPIPKQPWNRIGAAFVVGYLNSPRIDLVIAKPNTGSARLQTVFDDLGSGVGALATTADSIYLATSGNSGREQIWRISRN